MLAKIVNLALSAVHIDKEGAEKFPDPSEKNKLSPKGSKVNTPTTVYFDVVLTRSENWFFVKYKPCSWKSRLGSRGLVRETWSFYLV